MEPAPVAACDRTRRPGAAVRQPVVRSLRPPRLRPIVAEDHQDAFASEHRSLSDPALDGPKHRVDKHSGHRFQYDISSAATEATLWPRGKRRRNESINVVDNERTGEI